MHGRRHVKAGDQREKGIIEADGLHCALHPTVRIRGDIGPRVRIGQHGEVVLQRIGAVGDVGCVVPGPEAELVSQRVIDEKA